MKALVIVAATILASVLSPAAAPAAAPSQPAIELRPAASPGASAPLAHVWLIAGTVRTEIPAQALAKNGSANDVTKPTVSGANVAASSALGAAASLAGPFGGLVGQAGAMAIAKSAKAHGGQIAMKTSWAMPDAPAAAAASRGFALEISAPAVPLEGYRVALVKLETTADDVRTVTQTRLTYGQDRTFALTFAETAIPLTMQTVSGNRTRMTTPDPLAPGEYALVLRPVAEKPLDPAAAAAVMGKSVDGSVPPWQYAWAFKVEARG